MAAGKLPAGGRHWALTGEGKWVCTVFSRVCMHMCVCVVWHIWGGVQGGHAGGQQVSFGTQPVDPAACHRPWCPEAARTCTLPEH